MPLMQKGPAFGICLECFGALIVDDYHTGDCICTSCGLIQGRLVDDLREEKTTFAATVSNAGGAKDNARTSRIDGIIGSVLGMKGTSVQLNSSLASSVKEAGNHTVTYKTKQVRTGRWDVDLYCDSMDLQENIKVCSFIDVVFGQ